MNVVLSNQGHAGQRVQVQGFGFRACSNGTPAVFFGTVQADPTTEVVTSSGPFDIITVTVPTAAPVGITPIDGRVHVTVTVFNSYGAGADHPSATSTATNADLFTYTTF